MKSSDKIHVVDDDEAVRSSLRMLLESAGFDVAAYASAADFLESYKSGLSGCVVADVRMPDMDGIQLQEELAQRHAGLPFIAMTGHGDVPLAVRAMKAGAVDFIEKPFEADDLISAVEGALALGRNRAEGSGSAEAAALVASLTSRERQVLEHLVAGHSNKVIAHELDISPRTVEVHRAHLMEKLKVRSVAEAVRLALAAAVAPAEKKKG